MLTKYLTVVMNLFKSTVYGKKDCTSQTIKYRPPGRITHSYMRLNPGAIHSRHRTKQHKVKYQVVKVSPGGSHLGANWERAGVREARRMLY